MSQHYDNPDTCCYNFASMDFGAASGVTEHRIAGPRGKTGKVREVGVILSEIAAWTTTDGLVNVGTAADIDAYALLSITTATAINTVFSSADDTDAIIKDSNGIDTVTIPADGAVLVTLTEGTGGSLTGIGNPYVIIDWF